MLFEPNQTEFSCDYQREVWKLGICIVPLSVSLADLTEPEIREGCTQIYDCTMEILEDMYRHPDEYEPLIPRWFICDYFIWMIRGGVMLKHRENYNRFLKLIPRFGFVWDDSLKAYSNERYPLFTTYLDEFAVLFKERKQNLGNYLTYRDFRLFTKRVVLTDDDLLRPLSDNYKKYFEELHHYALSIGAKVERKDPCTFRYIYKKLYILTLQSNPAIIEIPYRLNNGCHISGQFERFLKAAESQPDNDILIEYIKDNIDVCNGCHNSKKPEQRCGLWVEIRGVRRRSTICHASINKYAHRNRKNNVYTTEDVQMLKRMMDIRIKQIDEFVNEGK